MAASKLELGETTCPQISFSKLTETEENLLALWNIATNHAFRQMPVQSRKERAQVAEYKRLAKETESKSLKVFCATREEPRIKRPVVTYRGQPKADVVRDQIHAQFKLLLLSLENSTLEETADVMQQLMVMTFQVRDLRSGGVGKAAHHASYRLWLSLHRMFPESMCAALRWYPVFGSWKDLNHIARRVVGNPGADACLDRIAMLFAEQLTVDMETLQAPVVPFPAVHSPEEFVSQRLIEPNLYPLTPTRLPFISLACKWCPKPRKLTDRRTGIFSRIAVLLYPLLSEPLTEETTALGRFQRANSIEVPAGMQDQNKWLTCERQRRFRRFIQPLMESKYVPERFMCEGRWDELDISRLPGKCLHRNRNAIQRHTPEKMQQYMQLVASCQQGKGGRVTAKGGAMLPPELVSQVMNSESEGAAELAHIQFMDILMDLQKRAATSDGAEWLRKTIVLADVSGSMMGTPMHLSVGMAILISRIAEGPFRNRFITFSTEPEFCDLSEIWEKGGSLKELVDFTRLADWGGSTDFEKAFGLVIQEGIKNQLQPEEMPQALMVVSDMQFNEASTTKSNAWETMHDTMIRRFETEGTRVCGRPWKLPLLIYWNARACGLTANADTKGVVIVSGYSTGILKQLLESDLSVLSEISPIRHLRDALEHRFYRRVASHAQSLLTPNRVQVYDWTHMFKRIRKPRISAN